MLLHAKIEQNSQRAGEERCFRVARLRLETGGCRRTCGASVCRTEPRADRGTRSVWQFCVLKRSPRFVEVWLPDQLQIAAATPPSFPSGGLGPVAASEARPSRGARRTRVKETFPSLDTQEMPLRVLDGVERDADWIAPS